MFDSVGESEIELQELASLVVRVANHEAKIIRDFDPSLKKDRYVGDIANQNILTKRYKIKLQSHQDCVHSVYDYIKLG